MALDRLLILFCPIQHHIYSSKAKLNKVVIGIVVGAISYGLPALYFLKVDSNSSTCTFLESTRFQLIQVVYRFIGSFVLFLGIPMSFLFVANILFVISLCKQKKPGNDIQTDNISAVPQTSRTGTSITSLPQDTNEARRLPAPAEIRAKKGPSPAQIRAKKKADSERRYVGMLVALTLSYLLFHATISFMFWVLTR